MKTNMTSAGSMKRAILIAVLCVTWGAAGSSDAQVVGAPRAVVQAVQGDANVALGPDQAPTTLAVGSMVDSWNTVSTNENGKLFLKWETGILNSIGGSSSIFLASRETERGPVDSIEMTEGLLRVTKPSGGGAVTPYMVVTPAASIEPANYDEPVDFIVEVYAPTTAVVTVISGNLKVKNLTLSRPTETVLSPCQTAYVEEGKEKPEAVASSSEDLGRLLDGTTIPGTIVAKLDTCPAEARVSPGPQYAESAQYSDYEFEDWASGDIYPYNEIRVLPPGAGVGSVVDLPGVGRWIIPIETFSGWRYDPDIIGNYSRYILLDLLIYRDQYYLGDLRLQQQQYRDMVYLSQLSGDRRMMWDAQRQLNDLTIQEQWTAGRLQRLGERAALLQREQNGFAQRLPKGSNLLQAVSNSFNSPKNLPVVQSFRDRIRTRMNVQAQVAGLAGKELTDLRSQVARERDPQKRLALRNGLTKINQNVAQGKLPLPAKQPQVRQVVERLAKEQDPKKVQDLQKQLGQLTKTEALRTPDILTPDKLASLKQNLAKFPNPQKRHDLQARVAQLGQSVEERKRTALTGEKIDSITAQAAKEGDVRKRNELLEQLKELGKTTAAGLAGKMDVLGHRQNLESQLAIEQDRQKRAVLEKALEDQRKKQAELLPHQPVRGKQPEAVPRQQEDPQKQTERQKQLDQKELQKQQTEQKRQQILQQQQGQAEQLHKQQQKQQEQKQVPQVQQQHREQPQQQPKQQQVPQQQKQQEQKQVPQAQQQHREQPQQQPKQQQVPHVQQQQVPQQQKQQEQKQVPQVQQQHREQPQQQPKQQQVPHVQQQQVPQQQKQQEQKQVPQAQQQHREQSQQQPKQQQVPHVQQQQVPQQQQQQVPQQQKQQEQKQAPQVQQQPKQQQVPHVQQQQVPQQQKQQEQKQVPQVQQQHREQPQQQPKQAPGQ